MYIYILYIYILYIYSVYILYVYIYILYIYCIYIYIVYILYIYIYMCVYIYICMYMYMCVYVCICICICVYICVCMYIYRISSTQNHSPPNARHPHLLLSEGFQPYPGWSWLAKYRNPWVANFGVLLANNRGGNINHCTSSSPQLCKTLVSCPLWPFDMFFLANNCKTWFSKNWELWTPRQNLECGCLAKTSVLYR